MDKPILNTLQKKKPFGIINYDTPVHNTQKFVPPLWMMRQAGRYLPEYLKLREKAGSFWKLCLTPEYAAEITLQPIKRFNFDAAIIFSDILVIPQALGQIVKFLPNHGPQLESVQWNSFLKFNDWNKFHEALDPTYKALSIVQKELPTQITLIGFSGAPWTLITYMLDLGQKNNNQKDYTHSLQALNNPTFLKGLLKLVTDAVSQYLIRQIESGAEVVQIFDSWASLVPTYQQREVLFQPLKNIVQTIKKTHPHVPIIYFGRGISESYPQLILNIPDIALGIDQETDILWVKQNLQPHVCVQGNLDPDILCEGGNKLNNHIDHILDTWQHHPYIFNLGHGILPNTPIEHVEQLISRVRSYGAS